jgi:hypothetical protein
MTDFLYKIYNGCICNFFYFNNDYLFLKMECNTACLNGMNNYFHGAESFLRTNNRLGSQAIHRILLNPKVSLPRSKHSTAGPNLEQYKSVHILKNVLPQGLI